MANEGRDLKISILSDLDGFDTDRAATDLEQLGDSARDASRRMDDYEQSADGAQRSLKDIGDASRDASRDLDDVGDAARDVGDDLKRAGDDAKDYGRETEQALDEVGDAARASARETERHLKDSDNAFDRYGTQAEQTARKVDDAFDRIASASRSNTRKVDNDLDRASRGMDDFKNEAGQSGREAAASFRGGFEDVTEGVQEVAANAFGGFGPLGAAAGLAIAAGLGIGVSMLEKAADKANEVKQRVIDLSNEIVDAGGKLEDVDIAEQMRSWSDEIADNKSWWELWQESNTTNLEKVKEAADETGIGFETMFAAMSGLDADAAQDVLDNLNQQIEEQRQLREDYLETLGKQEDRQGAISQAYLGEIEALEERKQAVEEALGVTEDATEMARLEKEAIDEVVAAQEEEARAAEEVAEAQRRASEAREEATELIEDFIDPLESYTEALEETGDKHGATIDQMITDLEEQVTAQRDWADNLQTLAKRGVDEGVLAELARLGPEGAPMVQELTNASDKKLQEWATLMGVQAEHGVNDRFIASLIDGKPGVERAGEGLGQAAVDGINNKQGAVASAARGTRRAMETELAGSPINVDVDINGPSRSQLWAVRSTISNSLGTITVPVAPGTLKASRMRS